MNAYTKRVRKGAIYTDGRHPFEVEHVWPLGAIKLRNLETDEFSVYTITPFRRRFWLVAR